MTAPSYPIFLPDESLEIRSDCSSDGEDDTTHSGVPSSATSLEDETMPTTYSDQVNARDFVDVRRIIHKIFPQNVKSPNDPLVEIAQLKGGITNMLLLCSYPSASSPGGLNRVLVRAYGNGTSTIIDRDRELATHLHLHSHKLAPTLYARLSNALIYQYIPGKAVDYTDLSRPQIMSGVASRLAEWHCKLDQHAIEAEMDRLKRLTSSKPQKSSSDIYELLVEWIEVLPTETEAQKKRAKDLSTELAWIKTSIASSGGPTVVGHCDLLSGNIIVPEDWEPCVKGTAREHDNSTFEPSQLTSFIDYEYSIPTPRAFDLANHFMEWQGFDCVVELIPEPSKTNPVMRTWAKQYLCSLAFFASENNKQQQQHEGDVAASVSDKDVDSLIEEVQTWWGMPGFYWGIWAIIQATISEIDFDYAEYAEKRLAEYYKWKSARGE